MNNMETIQELYRLLKEVLDTLEELSTYCESNEKFLNSSSEVINLSKKHLKTRQVGRELVTNDFEKLSKNIFFRLMSKELKPTFISYLNLITDLIEEALLLLKEEGANIDKLNAYRSKVIELDKQSDKHFKKLKTTTPE